jgi:hypothetical protein
MAVVTTFATTPILHLITRRLPPEPERASIAPSAVMARGGGVLAPISHPQAFAGTLDLALAATRAHDPPPRLLALVHRPAGGVRSGLREQEGEPGSPLLQEAQRRARAEGREVEPRALWTDDPASDILLAAQDPAIGWLLLGFHRPVFGRDLMGGVVKEILDRATGVGFHIGVIVHGHDRPIDRVIVVLDDSRHGRAALELATRVAQRRACSLHAVLAPKGGDPEDPALQALVREAARAAGKWLHTDLLGGRNPAQLAYKTHGPLVVMGRDLVEELGLPLDDVPGAERCVVIVQGGEAISLEQVTGAAN